MHLNPSLIISLLSVSPLLVAADKSPRIKKNPKGIVALADFPASFDQNVKGNVVFTAKEGEFVNVHVDVTGLPKDGQPFFYHIHEFPVPADGNCESVGLHFNPYNAPADCDSQKDDSYCQVGDLAGKHGYINTTCFEANYIDEYLSLNKKSNSNIIGKSVVFHYENMTKFACANIDVVDGNRLQSLRQEYESTDDAEYEQLKFEIESDYVFDEDFALLAENLETVPEDEDVSDPLLDFNSPKNSSTFGVEVGTNNGSNTSEVSPHGASTDCENGSSFKAIGIASCIAAVMGLFI